MSVLDKKTDINTSEANPIQVKTWCDVDRHGLFKFFTDFNESQEYEAIT